ncbi:hypothetical protein LCGC14_2506160 [marine sediment metagenome]|uniref:Methyltransferase type 11 domain-containing protein n=1 Tax=marine sediment metagenome TaxID=412755 RepID=A0A0F9DC83_9ZZZZ
MKIQFTIPAHKDLISPFEDCEITSVEQIDTIPDATCTLIHLGNCCDFLPNRQEFLQKVVNKLRYGGHIIVEGTDLIEVSYGIARDLLQTQDVQSILFHGRNSCSTIHEMKEYIQNLNLKIINNRLAQYKYSIRAERPQIQNQ